MVAGTLFCLVYQIIGVKTDTVSPTEFGRKGKNFHFVLAASDISSVLIFQSIKDKSEFIYRRDIDISLRLGNKLTFKVRSLRVTDYYLGASGYCQMRQSN